MYSGGPDVGGTAVSHGYYFYPHPHHYGNGGTGTGYNGHANHPAEHPAHHGTAEHRNPEDPASGEMIRNYYHQHGNSQTQQRTMISPDLGPELPGIGSDIQFYESDGCRKEMSYYDLQPIQNQPDLYNGQTNGNLVDQYFTSCNNNSSNNDDLNWESSQQSYQSKPPVEWSQTEVLYWLLNWSRHSGVDLVDINMRELNNMTGRDLCRLTEHEFCAVEPNYGSMLYQSLQSEIAQHRVLQPSLISLEIPTNLMSTNTLPAFHTWSNDTYSQLFNVVGSDIQGNSPSSSHDSDREDRESTSSSMSTANEKPAQSSPFFVNSIGSDVLEEKKTGGGGNGRRGRPPKGKGNGKLWEFIRDLLLDPATNPSLIRWERPEDGIFKFVQSDTVAKMWGNRKQNPKMTYEKLSRAMRTYYSSGILSPVPRKEGLPRKLVYKFGPQASGWQRTQQT